MGKSWKNLRLIKKICRHLFTLQQVLWVLALFEFLCAKNPTLWTAEIIYRCHWDDAANEHRYASCEIRDRRLKIIYATLLKCRGRKIPWLISRIRLSPGWSNEPLCVGTQQLLMHTYLVHIYQDRFLVFVQPRTREFPARHYFAESTAPQEFTLSVISDHVKTLSISSISHW